jgi:hypothetical protein
MIELGPLPPGLPGPAPLPISLPPELLGASLFLFLTLGLLPVVGGVGAKSFGKLEELVLVLVLPLWPEDGGVGTNPAVVISVFLESDGFLCTLSLFLLPGFLLGNFLWIFFSLGVIGALLATETASVFPGEKWSKLGELFDFPGTIGLGSFLFGETGRVSLGRKVVIRFGFWGFERGPDGARGLITSWIKLLTGSEVCGACWVLNLGPVGARGPVTGLLCWVLSLTPDPLVPEGARGAVNLPGWRGSALGGGRALVGLLIG